MALFAAGVLIALIGVTAAVANNPCEDEDGSTNLACRWDASRQGNGKGSDVINVAYGRLWFRL